MSKWWGWGQSFDQWSLSPQSRQVYEKVLAHGATLVSTGSGVLRGRGGCAGGVGDVRWDGELCRPTSGTPKAGREVGHLGWAADGTPDTGWANLARTSRMRRWTSWAADVADSALTAGRANLARTSQMRRSTSTLMRRASASGVLDDTLTAGWVRCFGAKWGALK